MHRRGVHPTKRRARATSATCPGRPRKGHLTLSSSPEVRTRFPRLHRISPPTPPVRHRARRGARACAVAGAIVALVALVGGSVSLSRGAAAGPPPGTALPTGAGMVLNAPIVGAAAVPDGSGYWLEGADGGVFAFGQAAFYGSTGAMHLNQPTVGIHATRDGLGYWEVASDGGVFAFGDAGFYGSTGAMHLNQPIVVIEPPPDGGGYWLVASDGGVFAFGDAVFHGSATGLSSTSTVVGLAATPDGRGYWEAAANGAVFAFGDAAYAGGASWSHATVGIGALGSGYRLVASAGGVFTFGNAGFYGSLAGSTVFSPLAQAHGVGADGVTDFQRQAWFRVNMCEEGGLWNVDGPVYSGGLGFSHANWAALNTFGYPADAAHATAEQQIRVAVAFAVRYWGNPDAAPDQHGCSGGE